MQKTPTTTRNLPEPKCHLRNIRNIRGIIVSGLVRKRWVQECSNCCDTFTLKRADARQIDVGNVRNITQVIGQYKAPTVTESHSVLAVLAADVADDTNDLTSE